MTTSMRNPDGRTIELAVSRLPSTDPAERRGVLLTNTGAPGGASPDVRRATAAEAVGHRARMVTADQGGHLAYVNPVLLARYVTTLTFGIAVQAASGVGRDELQEIADAALRNWPL
jgi:hypothetical protein